MEAEPRVKVNVTNVDSQHISYRKGYKYQVAHTLHYKTTIYPGKDINTDFIQLTRSGWLTIKAGYAWDGASGPTIDTKSSMRGSCIHDALYQLIRLGHLAKPWREHADVAIYECLIEDGMWKWRAKLWRRELRKFAGFAADPRNKKKVHVAP